MGAFVIVSEVSLLKLIILYVQIVVSFDDREVPQRCSANVLREEPSDQVRLARESIRLQV